MIYKMFTAAVLLILLAGTGANAQSLGVLQLNRMGIITTGDAGARALALGGAYTSVSDDAYGLVYNPAGLAQIRKKEFTLGIDHVDNDLALSYSGYKSELPFSTTGIGHVSFVYPYPTYRGSLVLGFGAFRMGSADREHFKTSIRPDLGGILENRLSQTGSIYQYRFGAGIDVSPRASLGANLVVWDQSLEYTEEFYFESTGDLSTYTFTDNTSADLDAVSLEFGLMYKVIEGLNFGFMASSPVWVSIDGDAVEDYIGNYSDGVAWETDPTYLLVEDEYTLPMKFRLGISYQLFNFLVSADAEYCDYSQTKYNGTRLFNELYPEEDILNEVVDLHAGVEFTVPDQPIKLRAGYTYMPARFTGFEEIAFIEEEILADGFEYYIVSEWGQFDVLQERQYFTFGAGALIDRVIMVDLAVSVGQMEAESEYLNESEDITRVTLSGSYRF
ncbi:MAG: hypothetical protein GF417_06640 [Candidatus Latescibacteria bacterium]|nr:hypothetical protein [bacterium]MBD3424095.1 hypothetical protein [Candidatus Latescibacterota bacterium]